MPLFPDVPEDLEAVEADELRGLLDEFKTIGASLAEDMRRPVEEREFLREMAPAEITAVLAAAAKEKTRIEEARDAREEAEATFLEEFNAGLAALGVEEPVEMAAEEEPEPGEPEPEPAPEPEPEEPAVEGEASDELAVAEAIVEETEAAAESVKRMAIPRGPSRFAPKAAPTTNGAGASVAAVGGLGGIKIRESTPFSREDYANACIALAKRLGPVKHVRGGSEDRFPVAAARYSFPDEFTLKVRDEEGNLEKIRAVASEWLGMPTEIEVFQAAGGICAPPTPFYDVPGFASRARPVRDALPSFNAVRGGVSIPSVNTVDRSDTGVTVIEADEDAAGGTFATKACRTIECATWTDTFIGIISHCLQVGNLNARTWPEGVALENDNLMAGWAATAETRLLDRIRALSVRVTAAQPYNALHGLIYAIARAKASVRNVLRAETDGAYTALAPEWLLELILADLAAQSGNDDRYVAISAVNGYIARLGVNVAWYKDSPTLGAPQNFTAEATDEAAADSLDEFPSDAQIGLFLNGTFIHLDGGSLELGLVRDSTLNEINDYELFGESFENVARVGPEQATRWITLSVCPSGTFPALATALTC